jgi:hypothetical protein
MHILYGLLGMIAAFAIIKYRGALVDMVGRFDWAEKYLGSTYNAIVLIGVLTFFISFLFFLGEEDILFGWLAMKLA